MLVVRTSCRTALRAPVLRAEYSGVMGKEIQVPWGVRRRRWVLGRDNNIFTHC